MAFEKLEEVVGGVVGVADGLDGGGHIRKKKINTEYTWWLIVKICDPSANGGRDRKVGMAICEGWYLSVAGLDGQRGNGGWC